MGTLSIRGDCADLPVVLPLTEMEPVPIVFISGGYFQTVDGTLQFVGWQACPEMGERRVVVRCAIPITVAKGFVVEAGELVRNGHH